MREYGVWRLRGRLREQPPAWPRREDEPGNGPRRWEREPEPFEERGSAELYPGATVLEDLGVAADDNATLRILARYTVARVIILAAAGLLAGPKLHTERRIAAEHLALLPARDWERRMLERLVTLCRDGPVPALVDGLVVAAETAAKREHVMGAYGLYRAGYDLALARGWWRPAATMARGIGRLARLEEARYSARLWDRRAWVLERRAAREEEAAAEEA